MGSSADAVGWATFFLNGELTLLATFFFSGGWLVGSPNIIRRFFFLSLKKKRRQGLCSYTIKVAGFEERERQVTSGYVSSVEEVMY